MRYVNACLRLFVGDFITLLIIDSLAPRLSPATQSLKHLTSKSRRKPGRYYHISDVKGKEKLIVHRRSNQKTL